MQGDPNQSCYSTDVERTIEQQIQDRTHRRIGDLHVETHNGRVVVRGWTRTYYLKQLAQVAAREVLGSDQTIVNDIQVV